MKVLGWLMLAAGVFVCTVAILLSFYPGYLVDLLTLIVILSLILSPILAFLLIVLSVLLFWATKTGRYRLPVFPRRQIILVMMLLIGTYGLIKFYIPRRIAFALHRPQFQQLVTNTLRDGYFELNEWLGIYYVDEYATDSRGGYYFRAYQGFAGFGPDTMSYGFCFDANPEGTPFGNAHYQTYPLGNGWEWFRSSNDW